MFEKGNFGSNAVIKVIGVGGGGGNAINTMVECGLTGVEFIAANTDVQALNSNLASIKIQLGRELTKGLGAGANPDIGRDAALEDKAILQEVLSGADMVFVTAGMGGGTGTGAAPIIAQVAREMGALTVGVITKPFTFEGKRRRLHSELGIQTLQASVDTLITIPNQRLLSIASPTLSMLEGFKLADEVLLNAVKGISDIINIPGRVNVDFADVKTIMSEMGMALMGIGTANGPSRAQEAARAAINSPLLEDIDIEGATGILINITGSSSMTLHEISEASTLIQEAAHEDANIIFGAVVDDSMGDSIRVTVIATGFDQISIQPDWDSQKTNQMRDVHTESIAHMAGRQTYGADVGRSSPNLSQQRFANSGLNRNATPYSSTLSQPRRVAPAPDKLESQRNSRSLEELKREQNSMPQNRINSAQKLDKLTSHGLGSTTQEAQERGSFYPTNESEIETLTNWTLKIAEQKNQTIGNVSTQVSSSEPDSSTPTKKAIDLAMELSEVTIDEEDFEAPTYLRKKILGSEERPS